LGDFISEAAYWWGMNFGENIMMYDEFWLLRRRLSDLCGNGDNYLEGLVFNNKFDIFWATMPLYNLYNLVGADFFEVKIEKYELYFHFVYNEVHRVIG
jgi:hypothetical protein